jgi:methionyl-tRNA synthetase
MLDSIQVVAAVVVADAIYALVSKANMLMDDFDEWKRLKEKKTKMRAAAPTVLMLIMMTTMHCHR